MAPGIVPRLDAGEFVVVQGIADLVILRPEEIWILDFKTDSIDSASVSAAASLYRPQVELYAEAFSAIHNLPVTRTWIHFFTPGITVQL